MGGPNEGGSKTDAELMEEQLLEMENTRKAMMAKPAFKLYYEHLKSKSTEELYAVSKNGDFGSPVEEFEAAHFLMYERKVKAGEWPLDND